MKNTIWRFSTAGRVIFGRGSIDLLWQELSSLKLQQPLIVTDQHVASSPRVDRILREFEKRLPQHVLFRDGQAEPSAELADVATATAKDRGVDCVIGIGGGSNLDLAKVAATLLSHGGTPRDYYGFDKVPGPLLPVIAIPTTAGTGSEVSHSAVLTDVQAKTKVSILSRWLRPTVAVVDPALTDSCPPQVAAHSGIDALVHAIEAFTNRDHTELTDVDPEARAYEGSYSLTRLLAAEAIRLVGRSLENAVRDRTDTHANDEMAEAALLAGMAFSNSGVGLVHALEYPIGARTHCSHGEGNGLLLPHVMRYLLPHRTHQLGDIARWMGADVVGLTLRRTAEQAIERVVELQRAIGIRTRLRDLGLPREAIPEMAQKAHGIRRLMELSVRPPSEKDLRDILEAAY